MFFENISTILKQWIRLQSFFCPTGRRQCHIHRHRSLLVQFRRHWNSARGVMGRMPCHWDRWV